MLRIPLKVSGKDEVGWEDVWERGTELIVGGIFGVVLVLGMSPSSQDVMLELESDTVVAIPS
jgi:hypothetical protein